MHQLDLTHNPRLEAITDLLHRVSGLTDPQEVQVEFGRRMSEITRVDGYISVSVRGLPDGQYKVTRKMMGEAQISTNPINPWHSWDAIPAHTGGFFGEVIREPVTRVFTDFHLKNDPVFGDELAGFGSAMVTPLFDQGKALNWSFMVRRERNAFDERDAEEFIMRGNIIGRMTRNLVIQQEIVGLNRRLRDQLDEISALQKSLLPKRLPEIPRLSMAASYLTSLEAGGDYYDFFRIDDDKWGLWVADVAGHGAGAATQVAMMHGILHAYPHHDQGPAKALTHLNEQLARNAVEASFVTALAAEWDARERRLTVANAGHHLPSRRSVDGEVTQISGERDLPLGIMTGVKYEQDAVTLGPGETVVLYTDGITESFSPPPERAMFGLEGLHGALQACTGEPMCVIESIHERLYNHTHSRSRDDDQTLLAMKVME